MSKRALDAKVRKAHRLAKKPHTQKRAEQLNGIVQSLPEAESSSDDPFTYVAWVHSGNERHAHIAKDARSEAILAAVALLRAQHFSNNDTVSITIESVYTSERLKHIAASLTRDMSSMPSASD